jgi:hypothetical protein
MPRRRISSDLKRDIVAFAGGGLAALIFALLSFYVR